MDYGFTTAAYVVAAVLFILSLGGLSNQESAKRAVWYGIAGMGLAVFATLIGPGSGLWRLASLLIAGGGIIGLGVVDQLAVNNDGVHQGLVEIAQGQKARADVIHGKVHTRRLQGHARASHTGGVFKPVTLADFQLNPGQRFQFGFGNGLA